MEDTMKIIVGLGNPGVEYEKTRHNVGWMVVEELLSRFQVPGSRFQGFKYEKKFEAEVFKAGDLMLVKPLSFMNRSGEAVAKIVNYFGSSRESRVSSFENLYVVHDDLDIRLGEYKVQFGKGPKIHNGVNSVERALGTDQFWRVRMGVDNRSREERVMSRGREYVLRRLTGEEMEVVDGVVEEVVEKVVSLES